MEERQGLLGKAQAEVTVATVPVHQPDAFHLAAEGGDLLRPGADDPLPRLLQLVLPGVELVAAGDAVEQSLHLAHGGSRQVAYHRERVDGLVVGEDPLADGSAFGHERKMIPDRRSRAWEKAQASRAGQSRVPSLPWTNW